MPSRERYAEKLLVVSAPGLMQPIGRSPALQFFRFARPVADRRVRLVSDQELVGVPQKAEERFIVVRSHHEFGLAIDEDRDHRHGWDSPERPPASGSTRPRFPALRRHANAEPRLGIMA